MKKRVREIVSGDIIKVPDGRHILFVKLKDHLYPSAVSLKSEYGMWKDLYPDHYWNDLDTYVDVVMTLQTLNDLLVENTP